MLFLVFVDNFVMRPMVVVENKSEKNVKGVMKLREISNFEVRMEHVAFRKPFLC